MIPLYKTVLPSIGINRHITKEYRYAPKRYQGLGLMNIYTDMNIETIQLLLNHAGTNSQLGLFIQVQIEALQLEVGTTSPIFTLPYAKYKILTTNYW